MSRAQGLSNTQWSHMYWTIQVWPTLPISSSLHDRWETFTLNGASSSSSFCIGTTKGFENMVASSAMFGSLPTSTKNKRIAWNNKLGYYIWRRFNVFILEIKVGIVWNNTSFKNKTIWKSRHPSSNRFIKP